MLSASGLATEPESASQETTPELPHAAVPAALTELSQGAVQRVSCRLWDCTLQRP